MPKTTTLTEAEFSRLLVHLPIAHRAAAILMRRRKTPLMVCLRLTTADAMPTRVGGTRGNEAATVNLHRSLQETKGERLLFTNRHGRAMHPHTLPKSFAMAARAAGIRKRIGARMMAA